MEQRIVHSPNKRWVAGLIPARCDFAVADKKWCGWVESVSTMFVILLLMMFLEALAHIFFQFANGRLLVRTSDLKPLGIEMTFFFKSSP